MHDNLRSWLIRAGFPGDITLQEMNRGLGSTALWSFAPAPGVAPLVVRVFGPGAAAVADREARAMTAAFDRGVPVPTIVTRGDLGDRPLLVTTFIPGVPAAEAVLANPEQAHALGRAMGETLGRINAVIAPDGLYPRADQWIVRGGPALAPIRPLLEALPRQDRLLHLDYHLLNVLVDSGQIRGVIDWENAMAGPPPADLARTRAILRAAVLGKLIPEGGQAAVSALERGLVEGHASISGPDPHPALSTAWGLAMTTADLAHQAGKPGGGITESLVTHLAEERDAAIEAALDRRVRHD